MTCWQLCRYQVSWSRDVVNRTSIRFFSKSGRFERIGTKYDLYTCEAGGFKGNNDHEMLIYLILL